MTFDLVDGEVYEVDANAKSVTLTLDDGGTGELPPEDILANFDTIGDNDIIAFTNQFTADPPGEFIDAELEVYDPDTGRIGWRLMAPESIVRVCFLNDVMEEGEQTFDFRLTDGEGYTVDPMQNATLFTITDDNGGPALVPPSASRCLKPIWPKATRSP